MTGMEQVPRGTRPFVTFAGMLRENGFPVSPDQTMTFIEAIGLLGPKNMADIHGAAHATLAPPVERRHEFDALFRAFFMGQAIAAPAPGEQAADEMQVVDAGAGWTEPTEPEEINEAGEQATRGEVLSVRDFASAPEAETLRRFRRAAPARLPVRRSHRKAAARTGGIWNMRKTLREAARRDGEVITLPRLRRRTRQRRLLLLIDISGSMKAQTDSYLRFAHALVQAAEQIEVFTLGTRLTRVTRALRLRNREHALAMASGIVSDWDGGTRIGDALAAFLAVPRFAGFARSAAIVILSDGLERGDPAPMKAAVERLSRLAWRLVWLTPLAADDRFEPQTAALQAVLPFVDRLGGGASLDRICDQVLDMARSAA